MSFGTGRHSVKNLLFDRFQVDQPIIKILFVIKIHFIRGHEFNVKKLNVKYFFQDFKIGKQKRAKYVRRFSNK